MNDNEFVFIPPKERLFKENKVLITTRTGKRLISGNEELSKVAVEFEYGGMSYMALPAKSIDLRKDKSLIEIKTTPWK